MCDVDLEFECITYMLRCTLNNNLFTLYIEKEYESLFKLWSGGKEKPTYQPIPVGLDFFFVGLTLAY